VFQVRCSRPETADGSQHTRTIEPSRFRQSRNPTASLSLSLLLQVFWRCSVRLCLPSQATELLHGGEMWRQMTALANGATEISQCAPPRAARAVLQSAESAESYPKRTDDRGLIGWMLQARKQQHLRSKAMIFSQPKFQLVRSTRQFHHSCSTVCSFLHKKHAEYVCNDCKIWPL